MMNKVRSKVRSKAIKVIKVRSKVSSKVSSKVMSKMIKVRKVRSKVSVKGRRGQK